MSITGVNSPTYDSWVVRHQVWEFHGFGVGEIHSGHDDHTKGGNWGIAWFFVGRWAEMNEKLLRWFGYFGRKPDSKKLMIQKTDDGLQWLKNVRRGGKVGENLDF